MDQTPFLIIPPIWPFTIQEVWPMLAFRHWVHNTDKTANFPNIQLMYFWFRQNSPNMSTFLKTHQFNYEIADKLMNVDKNHSIEVILATLLYPSSLGYIQLNSSSINDKPQIYPNYFGSKEDMGTMIRAIRLQVSYTNSKSYSRKMENIWCCRWKIALEFERRQESIYWKCYISYYGSYFVSSHRHMQNGTKSDNGSVVDERLRVKSVNGLRVIDASM